MPPERGAEGARRGIADAFGNLAHPDVLPAEQIFGDGHSPRQQVFHRRPAHRAREAFERVLFGLRARDRTSLHAQGWDVIATMRTPRADVLPRSDRIRVLPLDVTRPESIAAAIEASGPIDVLVNNAGIGGIGVFEVTPMATVRELFETNTFGVMAMTQAVLPQMRLRRFGVVVNVTSSATPGVVCAGHEHHEGVRRG